jgi:acyl-CoA thioesterase-1
MRKHLIFALALSMLCAAGSEPKRIVVLGDSIAAGYGLDAEEAFPALIQEKIQRARLNYTVVNAGVSGDTTAGGLRRIGWLLRQPVHILILELGGNDGLRGISPEETEKNLRGIVEKVREKYPSAQIVLAGMQMPENMGPDYVAKFREIFPRVAKETKSALVPFLLEGVGGKAELNQPDRIHPTAEGHRIVAENVWKTLKPLLRGS